MKRGAVQTIIFLITLLSGCATLPGVDTPMVRVVGLEPLPSEGLEVRFALKLRVQNPNEGPLAYNGLSVNLDLDGRGLASGVSNVSGEIPRFSDAVLTVPVSISAFSVIRQLLAQARKSQSANNGISQPLAYSLRGKLGAANGNFRATRFSDSGELDLFSLNTSEETTQSVPSSD